MPENVLQKGMKNKHDTKTTGVQKHKHRRKLVEMKNKVLPKDSVEISLISLIFLVYFFPLEKKNWMLSKYHSFLSFFLVYFFPKVDLIFFYFFLLIFKYECQ